MMAGRAAERGGTLTRNAAAVSWMAPPIAAAATRRPVARNDAFEVGSSSDSGSRSRASPAPTTTPRAARRTDNRCDPGTRRSIALFTERPTTWAASTDSPAAMPWCHPARGINDGPNAAVRARLASGASGPPSGLMRSATATASYMIRCPVSSRGLQLASGAAAAIGSSPGPTAVQRSPAADGQLNTRYAGWTSPTSGDADVRRRSGRGDHHKRVMPTLGMWSTLVPSCCGGAARDTT